MSPIIKPIPTIWSKSHNGNYQAGVNGLILLVEPHGALWRFRVSLGPTLLTSCDDVPSYSEACFGAAMWAHGYQAAEAHYRIRETA